MKEWGNSIKLNSYKINFDLFFKSYSFLFLFLKMFNSIEKTRNNIFLIKKVFTFYKFENPLTNIYTIQKTTHTRLKKYRLYSDSYFVLF